MINAGKVLKLLSSDFTSFMFLEILLMGKPYQWVTYFGCFVNQSLEKRTEIEKNEDHAYAFEKTHTQFISWREMF